MLDYEDQTVWVGRNFKKVKAEIEASGRPVVALRGALDATLVQLLTDPITRDLESLQLNGWSKGAARDAFLACKRLRRLRALNLFNIQSRSPHRIVEQLFGAVRFERLESLDLDGSTLGDDGVAALAASPSLATLQSLKLSSCDLSEASVEHLAGSKHLGQLRELDLEFNQLSLDAAARLVTSPNLPRLESLSISGEFGKRFTAFTSLEGPARLRSLVLSNTRTSKGLLAALSNAPALSALRSLKLRAATLGAADAPFAQGAALRSLEALSLIDVRVSAATLASLLDGPALSKLRALELWSTPLRDDGAKVIASSPTLSRLDSLRVDACAVGDAGARAIASSRHLAALRALEWRSMRSGDALLVALSKGSLRALESLMVQRASVKATGAAALAASTSLSKLRALDLGYQALGPAGAMALVSGDGLRGLERIELSDCSLAMKGARALLGGDFPSLTSINLFACSLDDDQQDELRQHPRYGQALKF
ncbi:MAG: hypothetical protein U0326_33410 [Polyangiales bacterium]